MKLLIQHKMEDNFLKANILLETNFQDAGIIRLLSGLPKTRKKLDKIRSTKNLLLLKVATDQCLVVFCRESDKMRLDTTKRD